MFQRICCSVSEWFHQFCILLSAAFPTRLVFNSTLSTLNPLLGLLNTSLLNMYASHFILVLYFSVVLWFDTFTVNKPLTSFSASSVFPILEMSNVYGKSKKTVEQKINNLHPLLSTVVWHFYFNIGCWVSHFGAFGFLLFIFKGGNWLYLFSSMWMKQMAV